MKVSENFIEFNWANERRLPFPRSKWYEGSSQMKINGGQVKVVITGGKVSRGEWIGHPMRINDGRRQECRNSVTRWAVTSLLPIQSQWFTFPLLFRLFSILNQLTRTHSSTLAHELSFWSESSSTGNAGFFKFLFSGNWFNLKGHRLI